MVEKLRGPTVIEEMFTDENINTMEEFKSIGLRTFCNVISETGLQVADVQQTIASRFSLSSEASSSIHRATIGTILDS